MISSEISTIRHEDLEIEYQTAYHAKNDGKMFNIAKEFIALNKLDRACSIGSFRKVLITL